MATDDRSTGSDTEEDHGWPAWAAAIQRALDQRNITTHAAAAQLGLRNATLKRWLAGEVPPQLSRLARIAELTGVSHAVQLELGNVLPPELRSDAHAIQVADELRRSLSRVTEVVSRATELAFSDAGARLAGILLAADGPPLHVSLRRAHRGSRYPVHLSTYVGVEGIGDSGRDEDELRRSVASIVGQSARAFGARWREQDLHDWPPPRPRLILNVPQHERPRPPASAPATAVPNLLMLGCPYAHAEYIGALLADALGYGYLDLRYSVPMDLDVDPADPLATQARIGFARDIADHEPTVSRHVWSLTDHRVLPAIWPALADAPVGCAIYMRNEERLLARGGAVWGVPIDEMLALRSMLDDLVASADWPVLTVVMPDELLASELGPVDRDQVADVAMLAAVDVWVSLRNFHFVPERPQGRLASMFDARGRPRGDPRVSMVRAQRNVQGRRWTG